MPGFCTTVTVAGAAQFTGAAGLGLFSFAAFDALPRSTRLSITTAAYATAVGASGDVTMMLQRQGGAATERALLLRALQADITGPDGDADVRTCGVTVPRDSDGRHWDLIVTTAGKAVTGTVSLDFLVCPHPDATDRDSSTP